MKRWRVETRATVFRVYFVEAEDEKAAEAASCDASCEISEDENEETLAIIEEPAPSAVTSTHSTTEKP